MTSANRPSVRFRRIGSALRHAREAAGFTIETAARKFGRSPGWISTTENGLQPIRVDDLADLLDFYGVADGPLRESLLHLAAQGRRKNWERAYEGRVSAAALDLASLESDSGEICSVQPNLMPGLLQIEGYTRALIAASLPDRDPDAAGLMTFRMARQQVLTQPDPPIYRAIISEATLHNEVGGPNIMQAQLKHLIEAMRLSNVTLRIIPRKASACLWLAGPFEIFKLRPPGRLTVSVIEHFSQSLFVEDERAVRSHEGTFEHLVRSTLDEYHSLKVIERILSES